MPERTPSRFEWSGGYWPTTAKVVGRPSVLLAGQNLWNRGSGLLVSSRGFGSPLFNSGGVNPLLNVADTWGGLTGGGSITQAFGEGIYFFAGTGDAYVNGGFVGSVEGGTVTIWTGSDAVEAGLVPPGAPEIEVDLNSQKNAFAKGLYSIGLTAIRSITGGESSVSAPSNAVTTRYHTIQITALSDMPTDPTIDRVGIYATKQGFGEIGPLFHLYDVDIADLTLPFDLQLPGFPRAGWTDGMLGDPAPLDYSPPPPCTFCFSINAVIVAAGCYGGAGLSPSYPNIPEAFPARFVAFIPGGGTVTAVKGSGIEGAVFVCTASSVNLVTASQSSVSPLDIRPIWPNTGVVSANQICIVGGEIFAWVGMRGPVRDSMGGGGDPGDEATAFAEPVMKFFEANGFSASNCIVVYDPGSDTVFYVNGTNGIGYCRYLRQWHTPFTFPVSVVTAVTDTVGGRALFSDSGGALYAVETGTGSSWSMVSQFQSDGLAAFIKTVIGARAMVGTSCRLDIFSDLNIITPNSQGANLTAGTSHGTFHHLNVQDVKSYAVGLSGTDAGGTELYGVETLEIVHPVRV